MELYKIGIRAAFAFICLLGLLRLSGKRTISQSETQDFVLALILGDLIDDMLWAEVSASQFVAATGILIFMHLSLSLWRQRSPAISRIVCGEPDVLIRHGRAVPRVLRRQRISRTELCEFLRHEGVLANEWNTIEAAVLEVGGQVTILERESEKAVPARDRERVKELVK
jgi:uncharacterized membrane protein YcaP (DUF421 family)